MFKYWQGYEIDGSDSAYNIITPEKTKAIEVILYYLGLKTIRKKQRLAVRYKYKEKDYSRHYTEKKAYFCTADLEAFTAFLQREDLVWVEISYSYIEPGRLYPEVRREIIDIMLSLLPEQQRKPLHDPVFWEDFATRDLIEIYFDPVLAQNAYGYNDDVTGEKYHQPLIKNPFCTIEFNCCLGADFSLIAYNLKHIAQRFPEFAIDYMKDIGFIKKEYYLNGMNLYERINLQTKDFAATLKRLAEHDSFWFAHFRTNNNKDSKELLHVFRIQDGIGEWDALKIAKEYDADGNLINDFDYAYLDILKGITGGKSVFTIDEYAQYIQKLAKVDYFSDTDFTAYSSVNITFALPSGNSYRGFIRWLRTGGKLKMVLDVPLHLYDYVRKEYAVG